MKKFVVIVAGGKGLRMGSEIPKQFLLLDGRPVLMHTMEQFRKVYNDVSIVLVLPESQVGYWKSLCEEYDFQLEHQIALGGESRFHSVKNGLEVIHEEGIIGIHDAVRPMVNHTTIRSCYETALKEGNAIPVIPINDSIRKVEGGINQHVNRENYCIVQTPQVFESASLLDAFQQDYSESFTDDASVVEANGGSINLVEGNEENIKLTKPFDFKLAELLIASAPKF